MLRLVQSSKQEHRKLGSHEGASEEHAAQADRLTWLRHPDRQAATPSIPTVSSAFVYHPTTTRKRRVRRIGRLRHSRQVDDVDPRPHGRMTHLPASFAHIQRRTRLPLNFTGGRPRYSGTSPGDQNVDLAGVVRPKRRCLPFKRVRTTSRRITACQDDLASPSFEQRLHFRASPYTHSSNEEREPPKRVPFILASFRIV